MNNQISTLLAFTICGIIIGFLFDIFRVTRKTFKTPNILIYIEDILFWILTGLSLLYIIITFTDGQIRLYMILMLIIGGFIYFTTISKFIIIINVKLLNSIIYIIKIIVKPLFKIKSFIINKCKKFNKQTKQAKETN